MGFADGLGSAALSCSPGAGGNVLVADTSNHVRRLVTISKTKSGAVSTLLREARFADGEGAAVRLHHLVGLGHKSRRTHSLKGIVPEVAAYGGGVAQETPPTRSPVPVPQLVYGSKRNDFRAIPGNTLGTVVDSDLSRGDPGDGRTNFEVAGPGSFWNDFWSHHETVARPASRRGRGAGR